MLRIKLPIPNSDEPIELIDIDKALPFDGRSIRRRLLCVKEDFVTAI
jgi:hypothetical protein